MTRFRLLTLRLTQLSVLAIGMIAASSARADLTIYEKDGWSLRTLGFIATHYQLVLGDGDPADTHGVRIGGRLPTQGAQDPRDNNLTLSRVHSGFIGTQIGFGVNRQISETVRVESLMAVSLNDVSSGRGETLPKAVDFREAWAALVTPVGTLKFGRMFSIFGSASAPVVLIAHRYGIGNPCLLLETTIACASVGAGPVYAGFDAQIRYISPRLAGFELQVAISDPIVGGPKYRITNLPRFDAELNFVQQFGSSGKLRVITQSVFEQLQNGMGVGMTPQKATAFGVMGAAILEVGSLSIGAGAWTGKGVGTKVFMEASDAAGPLAYDGVGEMRLGRGFFGNAAFAFGSSIIAAGGGAAFIRSTASDILPNSGISLLDGSKEFHVVFTQKFDAVAFNVEYMRWMSRWYFGETQNENFIALGASYIW
jgi:hypothetical protein